jgi:hypothetical protein
LWGDWGGCLVVVDLDARLIISYVTVRRESRCCGPFVVGFGQHS